MYSMRGKDKKMNFRANSLWLMCEWDFEPAKWAGIGFYRKSAQEEIIQEGRIVAIWIAKHTKVKAARGKRGMVVGFVELSGEKNDISKFVSWKALVEHFKDPDNKNKWPYAVGVRRAWKVDPASWELVDDVFENTYNLDDAQDIGTNGKAVVPEDFANVDRLVLASREVNVFVPYPLNN